jgi:hypothetical protein
MSISMPIPTRSAGVLAAVKDKPCGRPEAVLDARFARQPRMRAGRDGRMAPLGAEQKNVAIKEDEMTSHYVP